MLNEKGWGPVNDIDSISGYLKYSLGNDSTKGNNTKIREGQAKE